MKITEITVRIARLAQKSHSLYTIGARLNLPKHDVREVVRELRQQGRLEEVATLQLPEDRPMLTYESARSMLLDYARSEEMSPENVLVILARANRPEEAAELLGLGDYEGITQPKQEAVQYVLQLYDEYGMAWRIQRWITKMKGRERIAR